MASEKAKVCVTGAGGFLASWVVKILLSKDYVVHGTIRELGNPKYAHLSKLEKASENLKLFKADLLDYNSLYSAIKGCNGVLHVACPVPPSSVPNPEVDVLEPAVKGTLNVLKACHEAKVKRVIYVSSGAAVQMSPNLPKDQAIDETYWSDKDYCRRTGNWYCLSKTEAESEAFDFAKKTGLDVVSVCPTLILGSILQKTVNASSMVIPKLMKVSGGFDPVPNRMQNMVDVRDVAAAVILAYEKPEAEGRYICSAYTIKTKDVIDKLKNLFPSYSFPNNFTEADEGNVLSSERLQRLGWTYRSLEETLADSVKSYLEAGLIS